MDNQPPPADPGSTSRKTSKPFRAFLVLVGLLLLAAIVIPPVVKPRTTHSTSGCLNNLRQIDDAKEQWALEHKKNQTDTPTWDDLVGTDKYIKVMPTCPRNGTYTIHDMTTHPACTLKGECRCHNLDGKPCK